MEDKYLSASVKFRKDCNSHRRALQYLKERQEKTGESYATIIADLVEKEVFLPDLLSQMEQRIIARIDELEERLSQ